MAPAVRRAARAGGGDEAALNALRRRLASDARVLRIQDHGAGTRGLAGGAGRRDERSIAEVYRRAAARPAWGRFLGGLVRELRPRRVLELGTNLGVSAAHLALALAENEREDGFAGHLWTVEGDGGLADLARGHLAELGVAGRVTVVTGRFADVLPELLASIGPFDMAFVDGHHEEAATLAYWDLMREHLSPGALAIFDDIEPSRPVRRAWKRIVAAEAPAGARLADLVGLGLLFLPDARAYDVGATPDLQLARAGQ